MKVYAVIFDWSTEDYDDVEVEVFNTYSKAYKRFNEIISEEKTDISWVGDAFDKNNRLIDGYELDEHIESDGILEYDCWWNISQSDNWFYHDYISLRILEVK